MSETAKLLKQPRDAGSVVTVLPNHIIDAEARIDAELKWGVEVRQESEWHFAKLVKALAEFEREQMWRGRYASMNAFLESKTRQFDLKRSSLYGALWIGRRLGAHLDEDKMKEIGRAKLYQLATLTGDTGQAPPEHMVELATKVSVAEFKAAVKQPLLMGETAADLDIAEVAAFWVSKKDKEMVEKVFELARRREGIESRNHAFVLICEIAHGELLREEQVERQAEADAASLAGDTELEEAA